MKLYPILIQIILSLIYVNGISQEYEKDYVDLVQRELGGQKEVSVTSGYVDLLTDKYAIEVEFSNKWKQAIGQALWYGLQTHKQPGIVLIKRSVQDQKYVIQLGSALTYGGLGQKIKVWVWPDDFKNGVKTQLLRSNASKNYWLTISSKKRHNAGCRYYEGTNGRWCDKDEGIACKICGG